MQVLREALLQSLPAQIMQFTVIRNKILCLTQNQLILLCIDAICKKSQIPYNGSCVYKMQMSKDYIALLQRTGKLQIRRVDNLSQVIMVDKNVKIINNQYPRLKWWQDDLHLVYQKCFITVNALVTTTYNNNNNNNKEQPHLTTTTQTNKQKQLLQIQFSDLFSDTRSLFHIFKNEIILSINNNINVASIQLKDGEEIKQVIRLCHPFQQNQFNKQYLLVLVEKSVENNGNSVDSNNTKNNNNVLPLQTSQLTLSKEQQHYTTKSPAQNKKLLSSSLSKNSTPVIKQKSIILRVYNILTLAKIFQKQLLTISSTSLTQFQPIHTEILTDELSQYLLIKHYKYTKSTKTNPYTQKQIQTQTLLKVNSQYYYSQQKPYQQHYQPFFMFQIEIGLKKDLKLFPSHREQIGGKMCDSIDTCYFENNQVHIASIVLQTGYKNDIYHKWKNIDIIIENQYEQGYSENQHNKQQSNQLMIWRQLVEAKINPNKFIQKLINTSQLNKYQYQNHHFNTTNRQQSQQKSQNNHKQTAIVNNKSNLIGVQHQNILNSLLMKLHKINNFNLLNQKIDAYQTMKKILAIEYFPMLLDVMTIERNENKKEREILQKSNEDVTKTMSGCSSSGPQSPRSNNSAILIIGNENANKQGQKYKRKKIILKDISINNNDDDNIANPQKFIPDNNDKYHSINNDNDDHCHHCMQIEDHQNLQLTLQIMNQSAKHSDLALQQIQQSLYKMQTLTKYRLQKIQMKTRKDKKQSNNIVSFIENQFNNSLKNLHQTLLDSSSKFMQKISLLPDKSIQKIKEKQQEFVQTIEQKRMLYDNSVKIHKENQQQLLDYLYDIEFPQVQLENQPKTDNMFDFFNISDLSKSLLSKSYGLDKTINEMNMSKEKTEQQFRLFSEFVLKNFI